MCTFMKITYTIEIVFKWQIQCYTIQQFLSEILYHFHKCELLMKYFECDKLQKAKIKPSQFVYYKKCLPNLDILVLVMYYTTTMKCLNKKGCRFA